MKASRNMQAVFEVHAKHEGGCTTFACPEGSSILSAMEKFGLAVISVGCRGGGCGICKIAIEAGEFESGKMSKAHISDEDRKTASLACRTYPRSAIHIKPLGKAFRKSQRIQKSTE